MFTDQKTVKKKQAGEPVGEFLCEPSTGAEDDGKRKKKFLTFWDTLWSFPLAVLLATTG